MKIFDRLTERRARAARRRYETERHRQRSLEGKDAEQAVKDVVRRAGPGTTGHNS